MLWILFACLTALFESLKDLVSKQRLQATDPYLVAWSLAFFSLPLLWPLVLWLGIPPLGPQFGLALWVGGSLNVISMTMYIRAISLADLSLTVPLITLTPMFLLVTSPLIVGEVADWSDMVGIALIVGGSYVLNLRQNQQGWWAPVRGVWCDRGPRLMFFVALLWSITAVFDKVGVQNSSPTFWVVALFSFLAVGMLPMVLLKSPHPAKALANQWWALAPIGLFQGIAVLFQMQAINLALVTQVIAIKRTSALLSVLWGCLLLKETGLKDRLTGTVMMVLGVLCITLL